MKTEFFSQPTTNSTYGGGPMGVLDPFERKNMELSQSAIPESGQGKYYMLF